MSTATLYQATGNNGTRLGSTSGEMAALAARSLVGRSSKHLVPQKRTASKYRWLSTFAFAAVAVVAVSQPWKHFQSEPVAVAKFARGNPPEEREGRSTGSRGNRRT